MNKAKRKILYKHTFYRFIPVTEKEVTLYVTQAQQVLSLGHKKVYCFEFKERRLTVSRLIMH